MTDKVENLIQKLEMREFGFDPDEIEARLGTPEDWVSLLACHIYLDNILTRSLEDALPSPAAYLGNSFRGFSDKLRLCQALGLFPPDYLKTLQALNSLRNKFAHELRFTMSDDEKRNLFKTFSPDREPSDVLTTEGFRSFLATLIYYGELDRLARQKLRKMSIERQLLTDLVLGEVRRRFGG